MSFSIFPTEQTSGFDPCSDDYVYSYLNTPEVQKSLHANTTGLPGHYFSCKYVTTILLIYKSFVPNTNDITI